jgi:hypothetical protein
VAVAAWPLAKACQADPIGSIGINIPKLGLIGRNFREFQKFEAFQAMKSREMDVYSYIKDSMLDVETSAMRFDTRGAAC